MSNEPTDFRGEGKIPPKDIHDTMWANDGKPAHFNKGSLLPQKIWGKTLELGESLVFYHATISFVGDLSASPQQKHAPMILSLNNDYLFLVEDGTFGAFESEAAELNFVNERSKHAPLWAGDPFVWSAEPRGESDLVITKPCCTCCGPCSCGNPCGCPWRCPCDCGSCCRCKTEKIAGAKATQAMYFPIPYGSITGIRWEVQNTTAMVFRMGFVDPLTRRQTIISLVGEYEPNVGERLMDLCAKLHSKCPLLSGTAKETL